MLSRCKLRTAFLIAIVICGWGRPDNCAAEPTTKPTLRRRPNELAVPALARVNRFFQDSKPTGLSFVRSDSVDGHTWTFNGEVSYRVREGLPTYRCTLTRPPEKKQSDGEIYFECRLSDGIYEQRNYDSKEYESQVVPNAKSEGLAKLLPVAFPPPAAWNVVDVLDVSEIASVFEREGEGTLQITLTKKASVGAWASKAMRVILEPTTGQLVEVTAESGAGGQTRVQYRYHDAVDDAFGFKGDIGVGWTRGNSLRDSQRYGPRVAYPNSDPKPGGRP